MVLGRGPHHRRAADVDILDAGGVVGAARDGRLERIQVDDQKVDRGDAVRFRRFLVRFVVAHRKQAAMHLGMQGLHPPAHHFGKTGQVGDVTHVQADVGERGPVPPVEISSTPRLASWRAKSASPDLSETERSARRMGRNCSVIDLVGMWL